MAIEVKPGYKWTEVGIVPEDWEVRELGEIGDFKNGINKGSDDFGYGFPFVNLLDIFGETKLSNNAELGFVNSTDRERNLYRLSKGDVLFVRSSVKPEGVGLTSLIAEDLQDTVYSGFLIRFRDNGQLILDFKAYCFGEFGFRSRLIANSTVSANTNINQNILKALQLAFPPSKEEQQAIATALGDVDALLASLDALIAKKRDIKLATMQQLLTGKTCLPGFGGAWEVKTLGEITQSTSGGTPSTLVNAYWGGSIKWMSSGELNAKKICDVEGRITEEGLRNSSAKILPPKCILVGLAGQGKTRGTVAINLIELCTNQSIAAIFPSEQFVSEYLYFNLDVRYEELRNLSTGEGGRGGLNLNIINSLTIFLPPFAEQQAIADVLTDMDNEIATLEAKRDKIQVLKQGMMQELLTGKTRLL